MTIKNTLAFMFALIVVSAIVAATIAVLKPDRALGSITEYAPSTCRTATATTTETRITAGAGTTTIDCFVGDGGAKATLLTIFHASSGAAVLHIDTEYSTDGVNFFKDHLASSTD